MHKIILLFLLVIPVYTIAQKKPPVDVKILKQARLDTIVSMLQITSTDTVADVGSGNGNNLVRLSKYFPPIRYYVEDIDSSSCNRKNFEKMIRVHNPGISIDQFVFSYGTTTSTKLPKNFFTKVLLIAVVHEFDQRDLMLADIRSILKPNGLLFIEEPLTQQPRPKEKGCNNPYLTEEAFKKIITSNGFEILEEKYIRDAGDGSRYRKFFKCRKA